MNVKEHNLKTVAMLDDMDIDCSCGGKMKAVGKQSPGERNYGVCDSCLQEHVVYVADTVQVDAYTAKEKNAS
jgi:hypothetical protein